MRGTHHRFDHRGEKVMAEQRDNWLHKAQHFLSECTQEQAATDAKEKEELPKKLE